VRALALLLAAFVALGLDSYLFGLVTGDSSCNRAWTEAMLAAGLLGIGAVAIIAGFGLLVAEYVSGNDRESVTLLRTLFDFLRVGVVLVVLGLLFMTSWNYLYTVLGKHVPGYAKDLLWIYLGIGLAALVIIIVRNATTAEQARKLLDFLSAHQANRLMRAMQAIIDRLPAKLQRMLKAAVHWIRDYLDGPRELKQKVNRAVYSSFVYAIGCVMGATFFARTSPRHWDHPDTWVTAAFIATVGWVLLASLVPLFYLLVRCAPPFGDAGVWDWDRYLTEMALPEDRVELAREVVYQLNQAVAEKGLRWRPVFRKGFVAFQRPAGHNALIVDMYWRRPLRLAVKLPDTPQALALANPYPDLQQNWGAEDREWGWTLIPGRPIPDLSHAVEIARRVHPATRPARPSRRPSQVADR
jgi:MFS family permease